MKTKNSLGFEDGIISIRHLQKFSSFTKLNPTVGFIFIWKHLQNHAIDNVNNTVFSS